LNSAQGTLKLNNRQPIEVQDMRLGARGRLKPGVVLKNIVYEGQVIHLRARTAKQVSSTRRTASSPAAGTGWATTCQFCPLAAQPLHLAPSRRSPSPTDQRLRAARPKRRWARSGRPCPRLPWQGAMPSRAEGNWGSTVRGRAECEAPLDPWWPGPTRGRLPL